MEILPFNHAGKKYEIRIISNGATVFIRAFHDNKPANGYSYSIDTMVHMDMKSWVGIDGIKELIETAKKDIINGLWEQYLAACRNS